MPSVGAGAIHPICFLNSAPESSRATIYPTQTQALDSSAAWRRILKDPKWVESSHSPVALAARSAVMLAYLRDAPQHAPGHCLRGTRPQCHSVGLGLARLDARARIPVALVPLDPSRDVGEVSISDLPRCGHPPDRGVVGKLEAVPGGAAFALAVLDEAIATIRAQGIAQP
jgi:hypothetical protein